MPHLRELVELYKDAPFALVGVNCYDDEDSFKAGVEKHGVSWISAFQGEQAPIAEQYQVQGFPTYVLIDHEGKIVSKSHGGFDEELKRLVAAATEAQK